MANAVERHARNLVVMVAAGGDLAEVLDLAQTFGVRTIHVEHVGVPEEEQAARRLLIETLKAT